MTAREAQGSEPTAEQVIAEAEAKHRGDWQSDGDYGEIVWFECACEWVAPSDNAAEWVVEHEAHKAEMILAALKAGGYVVATSEQVREWKAEAWDDGYETVNYPPRNPWREVDA